MLSRKEVCAFHLPSSLKYQTEEHLARTWTDWTKVLKKLTLAILMKLNKRKVSQRTFHSQKRVQLVTNKPLPTRVSTLLLRTYLALTLYKETRLKSNGKTRTLIRKTGNRWRDWSRRVMLATEPNTLQLIRKSSQLTMCNKKIKNLILHHLILNSSKRMLTKLMNKRLVERF